MNTSRDKVIIRTGIIGIIANVFLAAVKAIVGLSVNSIAVILDAVNNLSDALSSVITIIGTALSGKKPDKKHPLGHGRVEYLTATVIAFIVMYAGITSLIESVKKIITPEAADYSAVSLIIIGIAVAVKIVLGLYVKRTGKKVNALTLVASGQDALFDAVISASTLLAAAIFTIFGISLEAYLGVIISAVMIKSAVDMLREAISQILGERSASELSVGIKKTILTVDGVHGAYDLFMHNYGPDKYLASVHIGIDHDLGADKIDDMTREITEKVYLEHGVIMTAVGIYAEDLEGNNTVLSTVRQIVAKYSSVIQMHGFYVNEEKKTGSFDVVVSFSDPDREGTVAKIREEVSAAFPDIFWNVALDSDISD